MQGNFKIKIQVVKTNAVETKIVQSGAFAVKVVMK
jgi:hypothetical protein